MHFKIKTISAFPTDISYRKLQLRADRKSVAPASHPPVAPLRLQAYRDTARSLGYPLAVLFLGRSRQVSQKLRLSTGGNPWKIITGSDWQPGTLKTPSEYCRRAFYALSRHFPSTFWIPPKNENYRGVHDALRRCTFIHYLHMLIVPFQYLFWTLLVPKVATGWHLVQRRTEPAIDDFRK